MLQICIHKLTHNQLRFLFRRVFNHRTPFRFGGGAFLMDGWKLTVIPRVVSNDVKHSSVPCIDCGCMI
jgi:hypothetical protein